MADGFTAYTPWFRSSGGETGIRPAFFAHHGGGSNSSHTQNGSTFKIQLGATPDVDSTGDFDEGNSRFVVPMNGYYYVMYNVCIQHAGNRSTEDIGISIRKNNAVVVNYEPVIFVGPACAIGKMQAPYICRAGIHGDAFVARAAAYD